MEDNKWAGAPQLNLKQISPGHFKELIIKEFNGGDDEVRRGVGLKG